MAKFFSQSKEGDFACWRHYNLTKINQKNMQINFHQKSFHLSDSQKDYISAKIEQLSKYKIMQDESVLARVDVEHQEHLSTDRKIVMAVTVQIPGETLRAESDCIAVEEGIDLIEEKLRHQLEKYKTSHQ